LPSASSSACIERPGISGQQARQPLGRRMRAVRGRERARSQRTPSALAAIAWASLGIVLFLALPEARILKAGDPAFRENADNLADHRPRAISDTNMTSRPSSALHRADHHAQRLGPDALALGPSPTRPAAARSAPLSASSRMVGLAACTRVSSVTEPSCIGRLRSTRHQHHFAAQIANIIKRLEGGHRFNPQLLRHPGHLALAEQCAPADAAAPLRSPAPRAIRARSASMRLHSASASAAHFDARQGLADGDHLARLARQTHTRNQQIGARRSRPDQGRPLRPDLPAPLPNFPPRSP